MCFHPSLIIRGEHSTSNNAELFAPICMHALTSGGEALIISYLTIDELYIYSAKYFLYSRKIVD